MGWLNKYAIKTGLNQKSYNKGPSKQLLGEAAKWRGGKRNDIND